MALGIGFAGKAKEDPITNASKGAKTLNSELEKTTRSLAKTLLVATAIRGAFAAAGQGLSGVNTAANSAAEVFGNGRQALGVNAASAGFSKKQAEGLLDKANTLGAKKFEETAGFAAQLLSTNGKRFGRRGDQGAAQAGSLIEAYSTGAFSDKELNDLAVKGRGISAEDIAARMGSLSGPAAKELNDKKLINSKTEPLFRKTTDNFTSRAQAAYIDAMQVNKTPGELAADKLAESSPFGAGGVAARDAGIARYETADIRGQARPQDTGPGFLDGRAEIESFRAVKNSDWFNLLSGAEFYKAARGKVLNLMGPKE